MCSFGTCQTRFEFLSQFRKVRNAYECFVTQVQTQLPKTKRVWHMKINVYCMLYCMFVNLAPKYKMTHISHITNGSVQRLHFIACDN